MAPDRPRYLRERFPALWIFELATTVAGVVGVIAAIGAR